MTDKKCVISNIYDKVIKGASRSEQKRFDIVLAARQLFLESGFDNVSMDQVAQAANVSKRTVYSHFGSKEDLFVAIMTEMCSAKRQILSVTIDPKAPIEQALTVFGIGFLQVIFDDEGISLIRAMIAQAEKFPQIGLQFLANGPYEVVEMLKSYFEAKTAEGLLNVEDSAEAAGSFLASMFGIHHMEYLVSSGKRPDVEQQQRMVAGAVKRFLYGTVVVN